jgi:hypothetical protein
LEQGIKQNVGGKSIVSTLQWGTNELILYYTMGAATYIMDTGVATPVHVDHSNYSGEASNLNSLPEADSHT